MGIYDREYYSNDPPRGLAPSWNQRSAIANIIIINVVLYVLDMILSKPGSLFGGPIMSTMTLAADDLFQPWMWWRFLSYGFAHSPLSIGHIFWNMLGLWMLGRAVEELYGRAEFVRIYLLCIVLCGIGWGLRHWVLGHPQAMVLGASGAVCCIEMLFVLNYPRVILMIWGVVPMPAWVVGTMLVLGNLFLEPSLGVESGKSNVAYDVHLIGIAFAFAYFFLRWNFAVLGSGIDLKRWWRRWTGPRLKVHSPQGVGLREEKEMDRLLQKIHDLGPDALTSSEKKFMEKCSRKLRQRRQDL